MRAGTVVGDGTGRAVSSTVLSLMTGFRRDAMDFRTEILNLPMPQTSILLTPIRPDSPGNRQVASTTHTCIRSAPRSQGFNHIKPRIQDWPGSTERPSGKPLYERPYRCELSQKKLVPESRRWCTRRREKWGRQHSTKCVGGDSPRDRLDLITPHGRRFYAIHALTPVLPDYIGYADSCE